jgi:hypothetical protein
MANFSQDRLCRRDGGMEWDMIQWVAFQAKLGHMVWWMIFLMRGKYEVLHILWLIMVMIE